MNRIVSRWSKSATSEAASLALGEFRSVNRDVLLK